MTHEFKVGQTVKLNPRTVKLSPEDVTNYRTAKIVCFLKDVDGGVKLDRHMGGFSYWNVADLLPAEAQTTKS